jgi:hypothetical protein
MLPSHPKLVMAGLVPAIHVLAAKEVVDARHKAGHDGGENDHHVA